jgi:hypothetical protein
MRKMEDNEKGLKGKAPMCPEQEVVTLSPILDTVDGMRYRYGSFDGSVPSDPLGYAAGHDDEGAEDTYPTRRNK